MFSVNFVLASMAVLTSLACMFFLLRAYAAGGSRLLLWSGLCFVFLSGNNILLFLDMIVLPDIDLLPYRLGTALAGILCLLCGFIWEAE
ncbi:MAG: DUF5985 family protein [Betaproteobacteria bacterium]